MQEAPQSQNVACQYIVISFRDRWYYIFTLEIGSLMTSSSSAGPIQISEFLEPWDKTYKKACTRLRINTLCVYVFHGSLFYLFQ